MSTDYSWLPAAQLPENAFGEPAERINKNIVAKYQPDEKRLLFVKSNYKTKSDGGNVVAFTEQAEAHPDGEVFVAGLKPQKVALTKAVSDALNDGQIIECEETEVLGFIKQKRAVMRKQIEAKKAIYRERYLALVGFDDGNFELVWNSIKSRLAIEAVADQVGD